MSTLAEEIAGYGSLKFEDLPDAVVHEVKRRLIDSFACALGAYGAPPVKAAIASVPAVKDGPSSAIIGGGATTPECAAFVNGILIRYLDFNDTYLSKEPAHPSDNIAPALATAEAAGRGGEELITAIVAAYELQCRLCDAASLRARGWDHVTYGAFSAALAASMLLGLTKEETIHALGIAGTTAPALRQTRAGVLSMWKGAAFAHESKNAVFSAMLAKNGMTGPSPVFEGEFGFMKLVSGPFELPPLARGRGDRFKILDTYIKYHPVEYHAQSAVGAALDIYGEMEEGEEIESVEVKTFRAAFEIISGAEKLRPGTRETADHSLPFIVAATLIDGTVTLGTFTERLNDERILALSAKVKVTVDDSLDRLYPDAVPNRVEVKLSSGRRLSKEIIYPKGHPKDALSDREVEEKFRALSGWLFSGERMEQAIDALWNIEKASDIRGFLRWE
ncbi:MAG: MmgE/PrpD family protein [Deltaproteobacteria bacterium]|nr:MmgE/PrpD family protein [Deltaproteobacteria bacterium]